MALIQCVECGKEISSAAPACPNCGHPQLKTVETPAPLTNAVDCPKCAANIKQAALVCPHCGFDVASYRENVRETKHTRMTPLSVNERSKQDALAAIYSQSSGCMGWGFIALSLVVWVIPIAGWVAAPVFLILGVITIVSPVTGGIWVDKTFNPEHYGKIEGQAVQRLQNSFQSATCPACGHTDEVSWEGPGGWLDCLKCAKRLQREDDLLFYIPNPNALTNSNLKAFAEQQAHTRTT